MNRPNQSNPQAPRIRVQQPAPAPARRETATRPAPAPAAPPPRQTSQRPAMQPRPIVKSGAGFFTKAFIWLLLLSLGAIAGGAYLLKGSDGKPFAQSFIKEARLKLKLDPPEPPPPPPPKLVDDARFKEIVAAREGAKAALDKASDPVADLTPEVAASLEKQTETLAKNLEELGALSTKFTGQGAEEISTHAKLQKDVASTLATVKVALEKIAVAKAAEAVKASKPVVVEYDLGKLNPWAGRAANTWVRWKRTAGKTVTFEDEVLQSIGEAGATVAVTAFDGETAYRLPDRTFGGGKGQVAREESVKVGDADVACAVVNTQGAPLWIPKSGRLADRVAVKSGAGSAVSAIGEEEVPVKGESKKCVRFERNGLTYWGHEDVPGFVVRVQGDGSVTEIVDWGTDAKPEFPRAAKAAGVAAEVVDAFKRANPWSAAKPGQWTRRKAEYSSPLASSETALDSTMIEATDSAVTIKLETLGLDGQVKAVEQKWAYALAGAKVVGEESVTVGPTVHPCIVLESPSDHGPVTMWIAKDGAPGKVAAILKIESMTSARAATAIEEATLRVGRHEVKCLHISSAGRRDDNPMKEEVWLSTEVPGGEVRRESVQQTAVGAARATTTVTDFGDVPARKTAIGFQKEDPARLEEQRVLKILDDAEEIVIGGSAGFRELAAAAKDLPTDPARLREVQKLAEEVTAQLTKAKETYVSVREKAPQGEKVDEKIAKIDKALGSLQKLRETIQSKLK
jgi:hypothetical protein